MTTIYESSTQTAKKIRKVLKEQFPATKFSVKSASHTTVSSVSISWVDGVMKSYVEQAVGWMNETYTWEGIQYNGTDYIHFNRELSADRKAIIEHRLHETIEPQSGLFRPIDWTEAERKLINESIIDGNFSV